jgi:hypothetical protein
LQFLDTGRQLPRLVLVGAQALAEATQLIPALPLGPDEALLGLDAQLLLGVLALLHAAQLRLALLRRGLLGLDEPGHPAVVLLGLSQPLLKARDVSLERLDGRFGGLGPARQGGLAALGGPARATFGQEVAFASPAAALADPRCLAFLDHRSAVQVRGPSGRPGGSDGALWCPSMSPAESWDPDRRDWRLTADIPQAPSHGFLAGLVEHVRDPAVMSELKSAVAENAVITHDGNRLFAYAAGRAEIERARHAIQAVLDRDGIQAKLKLNQWQEDLDEWVDPDDDSPERLAERAAATATGTRMLVTSAGKWVREELELSMKTWAEELGISCEIIEQHPHLLDDQLAFTITGPTRKLDEFETGLRAEELATIRTERQVMISPL